MTLTAPSARATTSTPRIGSRHLSPAPAATPMPTPAAGPAMVAPPTDEEKYWYLGRQHRWVLLVQAFCFALVASSLLRFALHHAPLWPFLVTLAVQAGCGLVGLRTSTRRRLVSRDGHDAKVAAWVPVRAPAVDVFLPSAGEPLEMLENTYLHVSRLAWSGPREVYVLDDSDRPEVAAAAARYGFRYLTRPDRGRLKKAGNLLYGYQRSAGDLIAIFDADFCPRTDFLTELVPYFDEPDVGIVQSPQFFDTTLRQNWLQRTAGATQELFYRFVQPSRDAAGAAICVGTNAVYRRAALAAAGGFAQIGHSEDVHTGVNLMKAGYRTRYVPVLVAKGLCPDELSGFISQQYRWCTGSMSLLSDRDFHAAPLTLAQRLCFWSGFLYYITTSINVFVAQLPILVMAWFLPHEVRPANYIPLFAAAWIWLVLLPNVFRSRWSFEVLRVQQVYSFAHAVAIFHLLRGRTAAWVPTGAARSGSSLARTVTRVMRTWVAFVLVAAWSGVILGVGHYGLASFWPMVSLLVLQTWVQVPLLLPIRSRREWATALPLARRREPAAAA